MTASRPGWAPDHPLTYRSDDLARENRELHRLRALETAAVAYVRGGLCGNFEIPGEHTAALTALIAAVRANGNFDG
jgi:hypothetical protein